MVQLINRFIQCLHVFEEDMHSKSVEGTDDLMLNLEGARLARDVCDPVTAMSRNEFMDMEAVENSDLVDLAGDYASLARNYAHSRCTLGFSATLPTLIRTFGPPTIAHQNIRWSIIWNMERIAAAEGQSVQEGSPRSKLPEKPSEDGYNWRKYGQKLVRGNQFVRSYYKCTFLSCPAKKQVERTHEGNITNINCRGNHEHPKPQQSPQSTVPLQAKRPEKSSLIRSEDGITAVHKENPQQIVLIETPKPLRAQASVDVTESSASKSNKTKDKVDQDADPDSKRRKRDSSTGDDNMSSASKTNSGSRIVIQSTSLVDIVNDGYRWRKYGQKLVKGNANPRSYYRCSNTGCPVKKHVERASHDPKVVITTYEGQHDHTMPSARTVTHNTSGADTHVNPQNGEAGSGGSGTEEKEPPGLEMVVHVSATE